MMKPDFVFFVGLFTTRRCQECMLLTGAEQDWVGTCCFWKNSTATTHRCSPTTGRQLQGSLAPVSAAGRKPCKARRHKAQHTACTPLRRWKQCHSLHNNLVVCTTNYQLSLLCGADEKTGNSKISLLAPGIRWLGPPTALTAPLVKPVAKPGNGCRGSSNPLSYTPLTSLSGLISWWI